MRPAATPTEARPTLLFLWTQFGPYHVDRCRAVAEALGADYEVLGLEMAPSSRRYPWPPAADTGAYVHMTLCPRAAVEDLRPGAVFRAVRRALRGRRLAGAFLCHYERPEVSALAVWLRLRGVPVFVMSDRGFADTPRRLGREAGKRLIMALYDGALVSGPRAGAYLAFLGVPATRIAGGYDTLSVSRIRADAGQPCVVDGHPFALRCFTVIARFAAEKDIATALAGYARYRSAAMAAGMAPRELVVAGDGPLRHELAREAARLRLAGVHWPGFLEPAAVARTLVRSLALLLPSRVEPWGLVANEALALGVPVLAATSVGALDGLLRPGVNALAFAPGDEAALAAQMAWLDADSALWSRLAAGARETAAAGDVAVFVDGVRKLLEIAG